MLKVKQDDYAYAIGRIRARELKLLDKNRLDRMLEASSAEEAYRVLAEAEYGMGSDSTKSVYDFETLLAEEMQKTYAFLSELAPQSGVVEAFKRRYDFFNVKVLLKAELSNQEVPNILVETGIFSTDEIERIIRERDYDAFPEIMREDVLEVYDVFSRTRDPQSIDLILDKALYQQFYRDLKNIDNTFINELADIIVDTTNIKMFIRVRALNKSVDFIEKILLDGGKIDRSLYLGNSDKSVSDFINLLKTTEYGAEMLKSLKTRDNESIQALEKAFDDYLMTYMQRAKLVTIGVEPFIAFLFAKEAEIKNVRIILTGKINRLPEDLIRERLRLIYV